MRVRLRGLIRTMPMLPAIVIMLVFLAGPILWALYGSLTNAALTGRNAADPQMVGLDNYVELFSSKVFPLSLTLTLLFTIFSGVIGQNGLGLGCALLLRNASKPVKLLFGLVFVGAWVLPEIVAAFAGYAFFHEHGTLNSILGLAGISGPVWLFVAPMAALILTNIWRGTTFSMMVYTAALDQIPQEINEAAMMDGTKPLQRFRYITLPMIRKSMSTNLMLTTLMTLSVFTLIYVMTAGGPGNDSMTLPVFAYQQAFKFSRIGYGTAIAVVILAIGAVFATFYVRMLKSEVDD